MPWIAVLTITQIVHVLRSSLKQENETMSPFVLQKNDPDCDRCEDKYEVEGAPCQACCPHVEHEHFICLDCGLQQEPSDYYDEDYGQER